MSERPLRGARLATAAIGALLLYLLLALLVDARIGRHVLSLPRVLLLFVAGTALLHVGIRRAAARGRIGRGSLLNLSLLSAALLVSLVAVDLAVSAYLGLSAPPTDVEVLARHDRNASVGEWYPRPYYPTAKNFRIHKPGFTVTGSHYGGFYLPAMLRSRTLVDSVLDRRQLTIRIDSLGFRDTGAAAGCPIFALGDSFTFGWGVDEGATWPDLVERSLGTCVYNLGVNDASPQQELLLLEDLLSRGARPRRVVWAIYEGNDLEDSYAEASPGRSGSRLARATAGTILEAVGSFGHNLRTESLLYRLRTGQIRLVAPAERRRRAAHYAVDGVALVTPLFRSPRFGYMLVDAGLLDRAAEDEAYVLEHRHRRQLDQAFARMRRLADSAGFSLTVAILPTSARLYAPYFPLVPTPSAEPHFIRYVERLAAANRFDVVDLLQELEPHARDELLYFRDDDHLNPRGHEVVAGILAAHLARAGEQSPAPPVSP